MGSKADNGNEVKITTYDRLLRAWENSMELVRDYEMYSKRVEDDKVKQVFKDFAEDEGMHATQLRQMLVDYKNHGEIKYDSTGEYGSYS